MGFLSESDSSRKVTLKSVLAVAVLGPDGYQECVGIWHLAGSEMPTSDRRKLPVQECIHIWLLAGSEMPMSDRRKLPVRRPHSPHYLRDTFSNTLLGWGRHCLHLLLQQVDRLQEELMCGYH
jgi:hypothetical protein